MGQDLQGGTLVYFHHFMGLGAHIGSGIRIECQAAKSLVELSGLIELDQSFPFQKETTDLGKIEKMGAGNNGTS